MKLIKTVEDVREYMASIDPTPEKLPIDDDRLGWFNCCYQARAMSDYSLKDIADMLSDGIAPQQNLQSLQETLDVIWEEDGESDESKNLYLCCNIAWFMDNKPEEERLALMIEMLDEEDE